MRIALFGGSFDPRTADTSPSPALPEIVCTSTASW